MPTTRGTALLLCSLALGAAAHTLATPVLAALAACGLLAVLTALGTLVAASTGRRRAVRVRVEHAVVERGEPLRLLLALPAGPRWLPAPEVGLASPAFGRTAVPAEPTPGPAEAGYPLPTTRHGPLRIDPVTVRRVDPLALARTTTVLDTPLTVLVLPRVLPVPLRDVRRAPAPDGRACALSAPDGTEVEPYALREYRPGDDVRRVHWASSARTGTLLVRQDTALDTPSRYLWLDARPGAYRSAEAFEEAVDTAASLAVDAVHGGESVRLWTSAGADLHCPAGRPAAARVVDFLLRVPLDERDPRTPPASPMAPIAARGLLTVLTGDADSALPLPGRPPGHGRAVVIHLGPTAPDGPGGSDGTSGHTTDRRDGTGFEGGEPVRHRHAADAARALLLWSVAARTHTTIRSGNLRSGR
ncbi:DUF58 domain-containing protein [Streptomyces sp. NPDC048057]|uniref:DUF58 domain-containing protein n=1 Tax=Streptomyces sp. NPDC048057 TaxID=3155628 RepID=UPI0033F3CD31